MKITRDENGNFTITFSEKEINTLTGEVSPVIQIKENPFRFLRPGTIEFLKKLDDKYKTKTIMRNDPYLVQLTRQYYITDLAQILRKLQSKGFAVFVYSDTIQGQGNKIDSFQLFIHGKY